MQKEKGWICGGWMGEKVESDLVVSATKQGCEGVNACE